MLDELLTVFRSVADALKDSPAAAEAAADVSTLEGILAEREQSVASVIAGAEQKAGAWLAARLHPGAQG